MPSKNPTKPKFYFSDSFTTLNSWDIILKDPLDLIVQRGDTLGSGYINISKSALTEDTETILQSKFSLEMPFAYSFGLSLSQRLVGEKFLVELVSVDERGNILQTFSMPSPIAISNISQTTTTVSITTETPHNLKPGMRINIYGVPDSRANYSNLFIATIPTPTTLTCISYANNVVVIPSITIAAQTSGFLIHDPISSSDNSACLVFEGISATQEKFSVRANKGSIFESGALTLGTTVATSGSPSAFTDSFHPTTLFNVTVKDDYIDLNSSAVDNTYSVANGAGYNKIILNANYSYKIRIRAINQKSKTIPIAKVALITKTASTTSTVTTDIPHGLVTGDYVTIYGVRDQTNFANNATLVAVTVIDPTHFSLVFGISATAISYGGVVIKGQGCGTSITNFSPLSTASPAYPQAVQSISRTSNLMTIIGNGNWSGGTIGDTIDLCGLYDTSGNSLSQYEGTYIIASISTTSLVLYSVGEDFVSIACGGSVLKRSDFRLHCLSAKEYNPQVMDIDMGKSHSGNIQKSIPVVVNNIAPVTINSGVVTPSPTQNNGFNAFFKAISLATTNATIVKNAAGTIGNIVISNNSASKRYFKLYIKASAPTVGTDIPFNTYELQPNTTLNIVMGFAGIRLYPGIAYAITAGAADNDTTAIGAGEVIVNINYV